MIEGDQTVEAGDWEEWNHYKELWQKDLSVQANYDALTAIMDVENYTDFMVAQIWSHNTSVNHNPMAWKPKGEGVWRWIFTDGDRGFNSYADDYTDWYAGKANMPFGSMLKNEGYRNYFCKRAADLLFTAFNPEEIQRQVTEHSKDIEPLMEQQVQRWLGTSSSYSGNALCCFGICMRTTAPECPPCSPLPVRRVLSSTAWPSTRTSGADHTPPVWR